jgi:hypothetical protein
MEHRRSIRHFGEGAVQANCSCGWRSDVFGADKSLGTMDPLPQADEAADVHEWDAELRWTRLWRGGEWVG